MGVDDAENLLALGVDVALRIPAGRFIFDRPDDGQDALSLRVRENSGASRLIEFDERLGLGVAGVALLGGLIDGVIDLDAVTRDPKSPSHLAAVADSGDHLHPADAGYKIMSDAIDLGLFR